MNAGPLGPSLPSELDRGAIGHEPDRVRVSCVQCSGCFVLSVVPRNSVQDVRVCSGMCGRAYDVRSRGK